MEESQTSRFITFFRERLKVEQSVTEVEPQLGQDDLAVIENFIEHMDKAEQGRAEREADPEYQAELQATLQHVFAVNTTL